jgi:hypothetical protein
VYDPEDDEPVLEDAWPHLRLVYKLLLIYLESPALKVALAARVLPRSWVQQLLFLFTSGDPRERTYAKTALHRLYGRFVDLRLFIRYRLSLIFTEFAFGDDKIAQHHPGIADLLEVLGTYVCVVPKRTNYPHVLKVAGDAQDHPRVCAAAEGGALAILGAGAVTAPQDEQCSGLLPTAGLLHLPVSRQAALPRTYRTGQPCDLTAYGLSSPFASCVPVSVCRYLERYCDTGRS